jgi:hypothetical protein
MPGLPASVLYKCRHGADDRQGVLDPPGGGGVLALDPDGMSALLQVAGLVDDQHRFLGVEVLDDVLADIVADGVGIPGGPAQQVLHAVRAGLPGPLRDRPAVLARQVRQQAQHQPPGPQAGFVAGEPTRDPAHGHLERRPPTGGIYAVTCGHRLFVSPNNSR